MTLLLPQHSGRTAANHCAPGFSPRQLLPPQPKASAIRRVRRCIWLYSSGSAVGWCWCAQEHPPRPASDGSHLCQVASAGRRGLDSSKPDQSNGLCLLCGLISPPSPSPSLSSSSSSLPPSFLLSPNYLCLLMLKVAS